jgi:phosphoribosylformylglycinamidine synthase subunit PurL
VRRVPGAWRPGDAILLASAGDVSLAGSELQSRYGRASGQPPALDLGAEAALVAWLWRSAPEASLAHDVSEGGLAVALAEAAIHSGLGAELELDEDLVELFGEGGGRAIVAVAPGIELDAPAPGVTVRPIGRVEGESLLRVSVAELRAAWESEG